MTKKASAWPKRTSLSGEFDANEIREMSLWRAAGPVPNGPGVQMDGAFTLAPRPSGVIVHTTDIAPRKSFETTFTASAGVSITVLLAGAVFADFDGQPAHLGMKDTPLPIAEMRCFTEPVDVTRKLRAGMRIRKAAVLLSFEWLEQTGGGRDLSAFFRSHKATLRWAPSAAAIAAAETLIRANDSNAAPAVEPDIRALAIVCPSSGFFGLLGPFCSGGSGSVSV